MMSDIDLLWKAYIANKAYDTVLNGGAVEFNGKPVFCGGLSYYNDRIKKHLTYLEKQNIIMDLGCGTGNFSIKLLELGKSVFAIDSNPYMLKELIDKSNNKCFISRQDINSLELPLMFDGIISNNVFYLSSIDPNNFLNNIHKYLISGGLFVLSSFLKNSELDILISIGEKELKSKCINIDGINYSEYDILKPQINTVIEANKRLFEQGFIKNVYSLEEICCIVERFGFSIMDANIDYANQGFTLCSRCIK